MHIAGVSAVLKWESEQVLEENGHCLRPPSVPFLFRTSQQSRIGFSLSGLLQGGNFQVSAALNWESVQVLPNQTSCAVRAGAYLTNFLYTLNFTTSLLGNMGVIGNPLLWVDKRLLAICYVIQVTLVFRCASSLSIHNTPNTIYSQKMPDLQICRSMQVANNLLLATPCGLPIKQNEID